MPRKALLALSVSQNVPLVAIFAPEHLLGWMFAQHLLGKNLRVVAITGSEPPFEHDRLQISSRTGGLKPNYVVDFGYQQEASRLATKLGVRFLRVIAPHNNLTATLDEMHPLKIDWRLIQAGHIYGVNDFWRPQTPLDNFFLAAVFGQRPRFSAQQEVFPVYSRDFIHGLFLSLFSPLSETDPLVLAGPKQKLGDIWRQLAKAAQVNGRRHYPGQWQWGHLQETLIRETLRRLDWQPAVNWEIGSKKTLQFLFQKLEEGKLKKFQAATKIPPPSPKQPLPLARSLPKPVHTKKAKKKKQVKKAPPLITVTEEISESHRPEKTIPLRKIPFKHTEHASLQKPEKLSDEKPAAKKSRGWLWGAVIFPVFLWFLPLIAVSASLGQAGWHLWRGQAYYHRHLLAAAQKQGRRASQQAQTGRTLLRRLGWNSFYFGNKEKLLLASDALEQAGQLLATASQFTSQSNVLADYILDRRQKRADLGELAVLSNNIGHYLEHLLIDGRLLAGFLPAKMQRYQQKIQKNMQFLAFLPNSWRLLSWLQEQRQPLKVLILLENNNELRPGGGFIGSFALATLKQGQLKDFKVFDVYSADGQLIGHVEPPLPIRRYLGEGNWYLRDSNWSADFSENARRAAWFLEKEMKIKPQIVIGVTLSAVQNLLAAGGQIYLPSLKEKINAGNLFAKAEFYAEKSSFPGSHQKANFLNLLAQQLLVSVKEKNFSTAAISRALLASFQQKELLLWFSDPQAQGINQELGWDGAVIYSQPVANTSSDYLYLLEANLGVNKANYFLKRTLAERIDIHNQTLNHQLEISYDNTAQSRQWPGGDYKNYLRVFLPRQSQLQEAKIIYENGQEKIIDSQQIDQSFAYRYQQLGFWLTVPINSRRRLLIKYQLPVKITKPNWRLAFYWQKQPGFGATPLTLLVNYPLFLKPLNVNQAATSTGGGIVFSGQLGKDQFFNIDFGH